MSTDFNKKSRREQRQATIRTNMIFLVLIILFALCYLFMTYKDAHGGRTVGHVVKRIPDQNAVTFINLADTCLVLIDTSVTPDCSTRYYRNGRIETTCDSIITSGVVHVESVHVINELIAGAYKLPMTDGASGQVLKTNASGVLTWQNDNIGAGGGVASIEEDEVEVDNAAEVLDFKSGFDVIETPDHELNISLDLSEITVIADTAYVVTDQTKHAGIWWLDDTTVRFEDVNSNQLDIYYSTVNTQWVISGGSGLTLVDSMGVLQYIVWISGADTTALNKALLDSIINHTGRFNAAVSDSNAASADSAATVSDNAITSGKIFDATILFADINQNAASDGDVIKWDQVGSAWIAAVDQTGAAGRGDIYPYHAAWDAGPPVPNQIVTVYEGGGAKGPEDTLWKTRTPAQLGLSTVGHDHDGRYIRDLLGTVVDTHIADYAVDSLDLDTIEVPEYLEDHAGAMVSGNFESGIVVGYDDPNGNFDFYIAPDGTTIDTVGFNGEFGIKDNGVVTAKIQNGTILFEDMNQNSATTNQVMKWNGSAWAPANDEVQGLWSQNGDTAFLIDADGDTVAIILDDDLGNVTWKVGTEDQTLHLQADTVTVGGEAVKDISGSGLTVTAGDLNVDLGTNIDNTEIVDQTIKGDDIDSTAEDFVFDDAYKGTSVEADSALTTSKEVGDTATAIRTDYATADSEKADTSIDIIAGTGLSGGGNLQADRTINHDAHTGDVTGATELTIAPNAVESTMIGADQVNDLDINFGTGTDQVSTDDVTEGSAKYDQALPDSGDWSTAYGWGDHSGQNYLDNDDGNVDTASWQAAKESVAVWDNRGYPAGSTTEKGIVSVNTNHFSITAGEISHKLDGIDAGHIDWGPTGNQIDGTDINDATGSDTSIVTEGELTETLEPYISTTADLFIKGDVRYTGQLQGFDYIWDLDTGSAWAKNASHWMSIERDTSASVDSQFIHPSVAYNPYAHGANYGDTIVGYDSSGAAVDSFLCADSANPKKKFLIVVSAYPAATATYEDQYIRWSDDGITWTLPYADSATQRIYSNDPIIGKSDIHDSCSYIADGELFYDQNGLLWCVFYAKIDSFGVTTHKVMAISSANAITWRVSDTTTLIESSTYQMLCPALVLDSGIIKMYLVWQYGVGTNRQVQIRTADSMRGTWTLRKDSLLIDGDFSECGSGVDDTMPWHIDVNKWGDKYLMNAIFDADGACSCLYLGISNNGEDFYFRDAPILKPQAGLWDSSKIYKTCLLPRQMGDEIIFDMWYSAASGLTWYTGHTYLKFNHRGYAVLWPSGGVGGFGEGGPTDSVRLEHPSMFISGADTSLCLYRDSCITGTANEQNGMAAIPFQMPSWGDNASIDSIVVEFQSTNADSAQLDGVTISGLTTLGKYFADSIYYDSTGQGVGDASGQRYVLPVNVTMPGGQPFHVRVASSLYNNGALYVGRVYCIVSEE